MVADYTGFDYDRLISGEYKLLIEYYSFDLTGQTVHVISTVDKKYTSVKFKFLTGNMNPGGTVYYDIEYFYP